jgi:peptide/nickel transport system substrate-binding protein
VAGYLIKLSHREGHMHTKTASPLVFRYLGLVLLVLSLSAGVLQPAEAQNIPKLSASITSAKPSVSVDPPFVPLRLAAPNCTYGGLIKSVVATDRYSVTFNLCRSDAAFISKIAMPSFAIYPQEWLEATSGATNRTPEGLEHPIGTGPYKFSSWDHGNNITFVKNPDYWGTAPQTDMLVFRWSADPAARLLELQAGTIDGFDAPLPEDYATIAANPDLQLVYRQSLNTFYIGMTNTFTPFNDVRVRQAVAMAIDRQHIIDTYYPAGSEVATHFTPCSIPNGCAGTAWYAYDPAAAKALLTTAGYPTGFPTHLYYRNVDRIYLPQTANIAQEIHNQLLTNLGIDAVLVEMESGPFIQAAQAGQLNGFHLLGWGADYPHVSNFLDYHFGQNHIQFGNPFPAIYDELTAASTLADPVAAAPYYTAANNAIRDLVPMVPVAHGSNTSVAYLADVTNPQASALTASDIFAVSDPGGRSIFRWMQNAEPASLFCADEADSDAWRACTQVMEPLYNYVPNGAATEPALAESCVANTAATIYTCTLRQGVTFHDGTSFDANDVVATFAMGLDTSSPYHKGNANSWDYYSAILGLMDTAVYTISGNAGAGKALLKYVDAGNRTVTAAANGDYSFKVSSGWSGTVTPSKSGSVFVPANRTYTNVLSNKTAQNYYLVKVASYPSTGANDGWLLESTETSNVGGAMNPTAATLSLGDSNLKQQYRSILSFSTAALPDTAVITKVTLKLKHASVVPAATDPITLFQGIFVDVRLGYFGTSSALQLTDFQTAADKTIGPAKPSLTAGWYTITLSNTTYNYINKLASYQSGLTQLRLRFKLDDNNNAVANLLNLVSGNNATLANRPTLLVEYYVP